MAFTVVWDKQVSAKFPELAISIGSINNVHIEKENAQIQALREIVYEEARAKYNIENLKNNQTVRAYRDFYWKLGIDPTKTRPSGEALLRRILHGEELPRILTAVDAYNLASMKTIVPISGFDKECLEPPFQVRFARKGEAFTGIGMDKPTLLIENMLVLTDKKQVLCIYPYRDLAYTRITEATRNVLLVGYGASGVSEQTLKETVETALSYIKQVCGGETEMTKVLNPMPK